MKKTDGSLSAVLRIPGNWPTPQDMLDALPDEFEVRGDRLLLADGTPIELASMKPDRQFADIFAKSCRQPASRRELAAVRSYTTNIGLSIPCGSMARAVTALRAGAAVIRAGGAGVFIDNSALAHGGQAWLEMADDGGPDAVSFAFVSIVGAQRDLFTMGMHVMGFPDVTVSRSATSSADELLIDVIRYMSSSGKPMEDGHMLLDATGRCFRIVTVPANHPQPLRPYQNPFGRRKLVLTDDMAQGN